MGGAGPQPGAPGIGGLPGGPMPGMGGMPGGPPMPGAFPGMPGQNPG